MLVESSAYAGMDAVLLPVSSLGTDGSQFAGSWFAAGLRVGSAGLACESVASCSRHSRTAHCTLLLSVASRLLNRF